MSNQHYEQRVEELPGEERGMPSVNESRPSTAARGLIVIALLLILGTGGGLAYLKYQKNEAKQHDAAAQKNLQLTNAVPARIFDEARAPPVPPSTPGSAHTFVEAPTPSAQPPVLGVVPVPVVPVPGGAAPALPGTSNDKPTQTLDKSRSSLMAGNNKSANAASTDASAHGKSGANGDVGQQGDGNMSALLSSTHTSARSAGMLGNRNFILAKGSFIDCALQTRLDSTVPGMTACVITRSIYSDNGKVLLIERGSTVTGEYKSNLKQGMARIFVLWSRIKTPNGVVINMDSPGTDPLGGAGVPGYIDTHFWQRFGGALMLSLVDDLARGVTSQSSSGNNQFNFSSTGDATQNMAAEALKNTINIPPTLYKNQGEQVGIYIARDLDFSSVYDVASQ